MLELKGYMAKLAESVPQLNAKMDTIGTDKVTASVTVLLGDPAPFSPVTREAAH